MLKKHVALGPQEVFMTEQMKLHLRQSSNALDMPSLGIRSEAGYLGDSEHCSRVL